MNHDTIRIKMHGFFDEEISARERSMLSEHAKACPECGKIVQGLEAFSKGMAKADYAVPEDFADRVMDQIEPPTQWKNVILDWINDLRAVKWEASAAGFASFIVLCYLLFPAASHNSLKPEPARSSPSVLLSRADMNRDDLAHTLFENEESLLAEVSDE